MTIKTTDIKVTKYTDGNTPTVHGTLDATDSRGNPISLVFAVDTDDTKWVAISIADAETPSLPYLAYNDRLLSKNAKESDFGYVFVFPTYHHNVMTEVQASPHWWNEEDYERLRQVLLDFVLYRLREAQEAASTAFHDILMNGTLVR